MLYTAHKGNKEIIAVTDKFGLFNVIGTSALSKVFKSFEDVQNNYKCFKEISEITLINYDLNFKEFMDQFESGNKECYSLEIEISKWKNFKEKLKIIRVI